MLKKIIPALSITGLALSGCATQQTTSYPGFTAIPVARNSQTVLFKQKTDTLFVIVDASASKNATHDAHNATKFDVEKQFLYRLNKTIPAKIKLSSGIRNFGMGSCLNWGSTDLVQDISRHSRHQFQASIDKMTCASGGSPMENALATSATDLDKAPGKIALLMVADGHRISPKALFEAQALEDKFGDKLCIYSVWVGNDNERDGQFLLQEMSNIAGCGLSENVTDLRSAPALAKFVEGMLYTKTTVTPKVVTSSDSDADGVDDSIDQCPNTPVSAKVNSQGCWSFSGVEFDFNAAELKPEYAPLFDNAIQILKSNPGITVQIEGHTDSQGAEKYNLDLSTRRAQSVKNHLVNNGIDASRLTVKGFGESQPISSNDTPEGRAENRRVTYTITGR